MASRNLNSTQPPPQFPQRLIHHDGVLQHSDTIKGVLRISTSAATGVSAVGLRTRSNERRDFLITTTSPSNEGAPAGTSELYFPHLADSGGYTTQFILYSGSAGQTASGTIQLFTQSGQPLNLTLQ